MKTTKRLFGLITTISLFTFINAFSQDTSDLKMNVLEALNDGARYASMVLLDDEGKSKCDYNMTEGKWYPYEPPWHTGQVIYALTEAYKITGNNDYLLAAKRAGDWWVSLEIKDHSKLKGMLNAIHGDYAGEVIVFATVSDGTAGLFKLYGITGEKKYADVPTRAGDWMLNNMCDLEEGVCYDNVDPKTGEVLKANSPFWPEKKNQTLYDVARPNNEGSLFLDMYKYTANKKYKEAFIALCESLVEKQSQEGLWMDFMPNHKSEGSFHPRFNLWYAESLLDGYELTGDRRYLEAAKKTALVYAKVQKKNGTIYYKNFLNGESDRGSICGSSVAFSGILWIRLIEYGAGDEFVDRVELSREWLLKNRYSPNHPDPNLAGAFINTRVRNKKNKIWIVNRDVGTSFAIRFLAKYYRYKFGE